MRASKLNVSLHAIVLTLAAVRLPASPVDCGKAELRLALAAWPFLRFACIPNQAGPRHA
jgi:hypothetical protein